MLLTDEQLVEALQENGHDDLAAALAERREPAGGAATKRGGAAESASASMDRAIRGRAGRGATA